MMPLWMVGIGVIVGWVVSLWLVLALRDLTRVVRSMDTRLAALDKDLRG
jgi:hypothetical protein